MGYIEQMKDYEEKARLELEKYNNKWWRRIPRERQEKKIQNNFKRGFAWAMVAYYVERSDLAYIENMSEGTPNDYSHFDEGAGTAVQILKELKMLGLLQQVEIPWAKHRAKMINK